MFNTQSALAENKFSKHLIISYKKGTSLKDTLVKAKTKFEGDYATRLQKPHGESVPVSLSLIRFQESKQDLIDSSLLNKRETGSS